MTSWEAGVGAAMVISVQFIKVCVCVMPNCVFLCVYVCVCFVFKDEYVCVC